MKYGYTFASFQINQRIIEQWKYCAHSQTGLFEMYVKWGHGFQIAGHIGIEGQETMVHSAAPAVEQIHLGGLL